MSIKEARDISKKLKVLHVYGSVGPLPWQTDDNRGVNFSDTQQLNPGTMVSYGLGIRTFSEQDASRHANEEIRATVDWARRIVFLGFSFHPANMRVLKPTKKSQIKAYGTALCLSDQNRNESIAQIKEICGAPDPMLEDVECGPFIERFDKLLAAGWL